MSQLGLARGADDQGVRVATWNVERPSLRSGKNALRIELLLELEPDILVLTETNSAVDLGPRYVGFATAPSPRKPREGEAVATIWLRRDAHDAIERLDTGDPREAVCVASNSALGPVVTYGSIIPYRDAKGPEGTAKAWEEHERAIAWHRADWTRLRRTHPTHGLITAGDYNQTRDGSSGYGNRRVRHLLTEALAAADLTCLTDEDFIATGKATRHNIDHVCATNAIASRVVSVHAWEGTQDSVRLSDHNGVWIDVGCETPRDVAR